MRGKVKYAGLALALVLVAAVGASAQAPLPFTETFDAGAGLPVGWTETHTSVSVPPVQWSVDATPAGLVGPGPDGPTFGGSVGSLNYNDGTNFAGTGSNSGNVTSPEISTVGAGGTIVVTFRCNYQTETTAGTFDVRQMQVLNGATLAVISTFNFQTTGVPVPQTCAAMGTYHAHTLSVPIGVVPTVRIRYLFNTVDGVGNAFDGWFVDSLGVTCPDAIAPTVPTLLTPADASIVSAGAVPLDWTDSTDTTSCGAGTIANYVVEVDITNPPVAPFSFTASPTVSTVITTPLPVGVYFWRVRAVDAAGNVSANSTVFSFTIEPPFPPVADSLFVNESTAGAQTGRSGFVDPVIDESPNFSAIYNDPNTIDFAIGLRFQIAADPTFLVLDFDSGPLGIAPFLAQGERTPDLTIGINLLRDTVYYWRIQFTDLGGLTGAFSTAQSFRIGDSFEFGVRGGSTHHGRRCYVSTAAFEGPSPQVEGLMKWREGSLEASSAGQVASRWYGTAGAACSNAARRAPGAARVGLAPLATAAGHPGASAALAAIAFALLLVAAARRL
ncbi:MAG: hypothetical protein AAB074_22025 [Planctomycetota bacterium]